MFSRIVEGKGTNQYVDVWYEKSGTPSPDDNDSPLIIPPLPSKPVMSIGLFRFLWTKAFEYVHEAEEMILCGYSLPDADRFALSLFSNFTNSRLKKVTVVDPDPSILGKWRDLLSRRGVSSPEWTWHDDFSEFTNRIDFSEP